MILEKRKLTSKQRLFIAEYLKDKNASRSASAAGYSKKTARAIGSRLLTNVDIRAEIEKKLGKIEEECEISAAHILKELKNIAMFDIRRAFDENGALIPIHQMPEDAAKAIDKYYSKDIFGSQSGKRVKIGQRNSLLLCDRLKALELLGKHLGLFSDTVQHKDDGLNGLAERMREAEGRLAKMRSQDKDKAKANN